MPEHVQPIELSIFELFKIGPGPSSSHTIGPMEAARLFRQELTSLPAQALAQATGVTVELLGSLSATGRGHSTDRAVMAGLLGWRPEDVDPAAFAALANHATPLPPLELGAARLPLGWDAIRFGPLEHPYRHGNTMVCRLEGPAGPLFQRIYYSVGGGFVEWEGQIRPPRGAPAHGYATMEQLLRRLEESGLPLAELMLANEQAITGAGREQILERLDHLLAVMDQAVLRGLAARGTLPGPIGLGRKAAILSQRADNRFQAPDHMLLLLDAFAHAVAEENAVGGIVVTAPTLGSAGVIPALTHYLLHRRGRSRRQMRQALLAAAAVGFLIKHNASIAGAEVGCQGEIGAASAMAAALVCAANGQPPVVVANAAEIALEHHLGLTCDPVRGYVQIPCIERNAMGAVKAYNAYILASSGDPLLQRVGFDQVVQVMLETGRDMSCKYKETAQGGLALCLSCC